MPTLTYHARRGELLDYFDRTAVDTWRRLTSDAPVNAILATVRAGRDTIRDTLLSWLPEDLHGRRVLDAGCGTGALAIALARRGAEVVAIDLSPTLVGLAGERAPGDLRGQLEFRVGDLLDPALGRFDHVVAMDSLIHYRTPDMVDALAQLAGRTADTLLFTYAPRTPLLAAMHAVGRLFPRGNRAPAIEPVATRKLCACIAAEPGLADWRIAATRRVDRGFYISQALQLCAG